MVMVMVVLLFAGLTAKAEETVRFKEADCKYFAVENGTKFGACVSYISKKADKNGLYTSVLTLQKDGCGRGEDGKSAYGTKVSLTTDGTTQLIALGIPEEADSEGTIIAPAKCFLESSNTTSREKAATTEKEAKSGKNTDKATCKSKIHKTFTIAKYAVVANTLINLTCKGDCTKSKAGTAGVSSYELINGLQASTACDSYEEDNTTETQPQPQPQQAQGAVYQQNYPQQYYGGYYPTQRPVYTSNYGYAPTGNIMMCNQDCMSQTNDPDFCTCRCQNVCRVR